MIAPGSSSIGQIKPLSYGVNGISNGPASLHANPNASMGTSDISMGAGAQGGSGYGVTKLPALTPTQRVNALPGVIAGRLNYNRGAAIANADYTNNLNNLVTSYGDPTAWATPAVSPGVYPGLTSEHGNNAIPAAPNQSMAQALGVNVSPAVAALARGNTIGPNGAIGNSTIAQLHMAAINSLARASASGAMTGGSGSGSLAANVNQSNIASGQAAFNANATFQAAVQALNQGRLDTFNQLMSTLQGAYVTGENTVAKNASTYPVTNPPATQVGGFRDVLPSVPMPSDQQSVITPFLRRHYPGYVAQGMS